MKAPAKLVCLETYWNERLFQSFSVKPFLEAMAPLVHPPLRVAHRFVESEAGLAYYTWRPGGAMWRQGAMAAATGISSASLPAACCAAYEASASQGSS